jgi:site-specific DNA recombinase
MMTAFLRFCATHFVDQLRGVLRAPEIVVRTWRVARQLMGDIKETEVREALEQLDPIWNELFPAEQARIVQLLVERVDVRTDGVAIRLRTEGLASLCAEMSARDPDRRAA